MKLVISSDILALLKAAAVDAYTHEASGWLLGALEESTLGEWNDYVVRYVLPIQRPEKRTPYENTCHTSWSLTRKFVGSMAIGGFHTHPDDTAYMSEGDKNDPDAGPVELVVPVAFKRRWSIPPSGFRAYFQDENGLWVRIPIVFT